MKRSEPRRGSLITLLRDADGDGAAEVRSRFLENLNSPFGMALVGQDFYVANTDAVMRFRYRTGETRIADPGQRLAELRRGLPLFIEDRPKAAPEHALSVERHLVPLGLHAPVFHDLRPSCVAGCLVGPFDERKDDILAFLGFHSSPEVRDLAGGYVVEQRPRCRFRRHKIDKMHRLRD